MFSSPLTSNKKGFSILMALGTTGILLILVVGLASLYINEMKLSRLQYDNIFTYAQAEGAFEYAMLKVKNHQDGFQDSMSGSDVDGKMFTGSTTRTQGVQTSYSIESQAKSYTASLLPQTSLIIPLFVGSGNLLSNSSTSRDPNFSTAVDMVTSITLSDLGTSPSDLSWSIIAMSGSESVGITGTGLINGLEIATMRLHGVDCYNSSGDKDLNVNNGNCLNPLFQAEALDYFYDLHGTVNEFLTPNSSNGFKGTPVEKPYLMIFNNSTSSQDITLTATTPFSLPTMKIVTESKKGDAAQRFEFTENKSKYLDALNFGVYNTSTTP